MIKTSLMYIVTNDQQVIVIIGKAKEFRYSKILRCAKNDSKLYKSILP